MAGMAGDGAAAPLLDPAWGAAMEAGAEEACAGGA